MFIFKQICDTLTVNKIVVVSYSKSVQRCKIVHADVFYL